MQAHVIPDLPGQERMLLGGIVADQQDRRSGEDLRHASRCIRLPTQRGCESWEVGRAMVVDIVSLQHRPGEFRKQIVLFICGAVRTDHANRRPAILISHFCKLFSNQFKGLVPSAGSQAPIFPNKRLREAFFAARKIKSIATLDAEEVPVRAALVAIVAAHDLHASIRPPHSQCGLAAVAAMCADRADMLHLPWPCLIPVSARGQRSDGADIDAHAALFALEMILFIRRNDRTDTAVLHTQSPHVHALAAHPHAAVAENAARPVEVHHRRPLLLVAVVLHFHELRFGGAIAEGHVLQFAFSASIANRTVQRMVSEEQFQHRLARLLDLVAFGRDHHALADYRRACGLQLGHLFDLHQAHPASALQGHVGVIAEGRYLDAHALARFNQQRACGRGDLFAVDSEIYIRHVFSALKPGVVRSRSLFHKGTAAPPGDLRTLCGTFSRMRWLASLLHRPTDKTFGPTCFPTGTACYRCLFSLLRPYGNESESSSASPFLRDRECTSRSFHADRTSLSAARISRCTAHHQAPPRRQIPAWTLLSPRNRSPWRRRFHQTSNTASRSLQERQLSNCAHSECLRRCHKSFSLSYSPWGVRKPPAWRGFR